MWNKIRAEVTYHRSYQKNTQIAWGKEENAVNEDPNACIVCLVNKILVIRASWVALWFLMTTWNCDQVQIDIVSTGFRWWGQFTEKILACQSELFKNLITTDHHWVSSDTRMSIAFAFDKVIGLGECNGSCLHLLRVFLKVFLGTPILVPNDTPGCHRGF